MENFWKIARRFPGRIFEMFYELIPGVISEDNGSVVLERIHRWFFDKIYGEIAEGIPGKLIKKTGIF